jgi:hypothetical protein
VPARNRLRCTCSLASPSVTGKRDVRRVPVRQRRPSAPGGSQTGPGAARRSQGSGRAALRRRKHRHAEHACAGVTRAPAFRYRRYLGRGRERHAYRHERGAPCHRRDGRRAVPVSGPRRRELQGTPGSAAPP